MTNFWTVLDLVPPQKEASQTKNQIWYKAHYSIKREPYEKRYLAIGCTDFDYVRL